MASENIATQSWYTSRSGLPVSVNSSSITWGRLTRDTVGYAKAYVIIDTSQYRSVTLNYGTGNHSSNSSITFGIFDNTSATDSSGKTVELDRTSSGSVTIDLSDVSGTKYVGFYIWGNSWLYNDWGDYEVEGDRQIISIDAVLYGYRLTYDANGGSNAPGSINGITSTTISSQTPIRGVDIFLGWSKSQYATSATYVAGDSITLSSDTTLYAVWRNVYKVIYDANGGSNAPIASSKIDGQTLILTSDAPTPPENTSVSYTVTFNTNGVNAHTITVTNTTTYEFVNWNTEPNGYGTTYQPGGSYAYNNAITLYAQYTPTTTYNSITLPIPSRSNYDFLGWGIDEYDTNGITGEYTPTEDITLYAIWKIRGQVYIYDNTGEFNPYMIFIYDGSDWNQYVPYIYTESGWEVYSG